MRSMGVANVQRYLEVGSVIESTDSDSGCDAQTFPTTAVACKFQHPVGANSVSQLTDIARVLVSQIWLSVVCQIADMLRVIRIVR